MIGFKGQLQFIQYMPKKPAKWGMKVYVLADSIKGYTYNWRLYTGMSMYCSVPFTRYNARRCASRNMLTTRAQLHCERVLSYIASALSIVNVLYVLWLLYRKAGSRFL